MRKHFQRLWAFIGEMLLALLCLSVICLCLRSYAIRSGGTTGFSEFLQPLVSFMTKTNSSWQSLVGILFTASLAVWFTFVNMTANEFGSYLREIGKYKWLLFCFLFPTSLFFTNYITLIFLSASKNVWLVLFSTWLLLYGFINLLTMMRNATQFLNLYLMYAESKTREDGSSDQNPSLN